MTRKSIYAGLDIGSNSIKLLVSEYVKGESNVIAVSNVKSTGITEGIIVDIDIAAKAIKTAVTQVEEKSGITLESVSVGFSATSLHSTQTQGMISVASESQEITDNDVSNVIKSALMKTTTADDELLQFVPDEFVVDGFHGIKDPRGMMGVRLEVKGNLYSGSKTLTHNIRKAIEMAGLRLDRIVVAPLAVLRSVLNEGEREFGTIVIDLGGGQTSVAIMADQKLQYTNIYKEGGEYITKDISKVLTTSQSIAESIQYSNGAAYASLASDQEDIHVEVIGKEGAITITERYLAEVIEARLRQLFEKIRVDLERVRGLALPGGIVLIGGVATLPGVVELAQEVFGTHVKLSVPNQVGIRNPGYATVNSIVTFVGDLSEVDYLIENTLQGETNAMKKASSHFHPFSSMRGATGNKPSPEEDIVEETDALFYPEATNSDYTSENTSVSNKVKGFFNKMFDD